MLLKAYTSIEMTGMRDIIKRKELAMPSPEIPNCQSGEYEDFGDTQINIAWVPPEIDFGADNDLDHPETNGNGEVDWFEDELTEQLLEPYFENGAYWVLVHQASGKTLFSGGSQKELTDLNLKHIENTRGAMTLHIRPDVPRAKNVQVMEDDSSSEMNKDPANTAVDGLWGLLS